MLMRLVPPRCGGTRRQFFPVVTPHKTKVGETLIVAVMTKPYTQKK